MAESEEQINFDTSDSSEDGAIGNLQNQLIEMQDRLREERFFGFVESL